MCNWNEQPGIGKAPETLHQKPEKERGKKRWGGGMNTVFKHKILGQIFAQLCHYGVFMIK